MTIYPLLNAQRECLPAVALNTALHHHWHGSAAADSPIHKACSRHVAGMYFAQLHHVSHVQPGGDVITCRNNPIRCP